MDDEIPPLLPPDQMPTIGTAADLHRHWRALLGELGFSRRQLWLGLLTSAGRMTPQLHRIDDVPGDPIPPLADNVIRLGREALDRVADAAGSVAFLLSRPGSAHLTDSDRAWARELAAAAVRAGVELRPIHLATDEAVRVFAPDDLIRSRSA